MTNLSDEKAINDVLKADHADRKYIPIDGSRWGELIIPAMDETRKKALKD